MKDFLVKLIKQGNLKIGEPSENVSKAYLEKSVSNLEAAKILLKNDKLEESVSFTYYSMYNLFLALLYQIGIKSENHSSSIFLLKKIFSFENKEIIEMKKERIDKQYYIGFHITKREVEEEMKIAENFNRELRTFILGLGKKDIEFYRNKFKGMMK